MLLGMAGRRSMLCSESEGRKFHRISGAAPGMIALGDAPGKSARQPEARETRAETCSQDTNRHHGPPRPEHEPLSRPAFKARRQALMITSTTVPGGDTEKRRLDYD